MPTPFAVFVPSAVRAPIPSQKYCRNGQLPDANFEREMITQLNQALALRPREVFSWIGSTSPQATAAGTRNRWRFAFKTGPMHARLKIIFVVALDDSNKSSTDPISTLSIYDATGVTLIGTASAHLGASATAAPDVPANFPAQTLTITACAPNTVYTGTFTDSNPARLVTALVYEEALDTNTANGYLGQGAAVGSPIAATDRSAAALLANACWKAGNQLWTWTSDIDAGAALNASVGTNQNLIDASTVYSASSAGATLNLANHWTFTQAGVPVTLMVYGQSANAGGIGVVKLWKSSVAVALSVNIGTTLGWYSVSGVLPAQDLKKYDLTVTCTTAGDAVTVYAASLFETG